jgi:hypothetical protein
MQLKPRTRTDRGVAATGRPDVAMKIDDTGPPTSLAQDRILVHASSVGLEIATSGIGG